LTEGKIEPFSIKKLLETFVHKSMKDNIES